MRLWHVDLIGVLPRQQLLGQWRECCCIASNLEKNGTPNHVLVNKIQDYPIEDFFSYTSLIIDEMRKRKYKVNENLFWKHFNNPSFSQNKNIFQHWHNKKYLIQCFYNLEEKHDCRAISDDEWNNITNNIQP